MSPHKPEFDNFTPSQIRVVCEQLLWTMDSEQRGKLAKELPGLYKKLYGSIPETMIKEKANQITHQITNDGVIGLDDSLDDSVFEALKKVGL